MKTNNLDKDPLIPGTCEWCGKVCELEDVACSLTCEAQIHREEAVQGRMILRAVKRWRVSGGHDARGEMLTELRTKVDRFLRSDRKRREGASAKRRAAEAEALAANNKES